MNESLESETGSLDQWVDFRLLRLDLGKQKFNYSPCYTLSRYIVDFHFIYHFLGYDIIAVVVFCRFLLARVDFCLPIVS